MNTSIMCRCWKVAQTKAQCHFFLQTATFCSSPNKCSFITVGSSEGSHHLIVTWRSSHVVHSLSEETDLSLVWIPALKAHYNEKPETRGLYLWMPSLLHFSPSRLLLIFYAFPLYNIHSIYIIFGAFSQWKISNDQWHTFMVMSTCLENVPHFF